MKALEKQRLIGLIIIATGFILATSTVPTIGMQYAYKKFPITDPIVIILVATIWLALLGAAISAHATVMLRKELSHKDRTDKGLTSK